MVSSNMNDYQIQHQPEEDLFYVLLDDGQRAYLKYRLSGADSAVAQVDFWSTYVPDEYRGQGLAAKLVDQGFEWADQKGLYINTSCWYASKRLAKRQTIELAT